MNGYDNIHLLHDIRSPEPIWPDNVEDDLRVLHCSLDVLVVREVHLHQWDIVLDPQRAFQSFALGLRAHPDGKSERGALRMIAQPADD